MTGLFKVKLSEYIFYSYTLICIAIRSRSHWAGPTPDSLTAHLMKEHKESGGYAF